MAQPSFELRVNPSDETIRVGPIAVRFLLTGDNSTGSIAAFELMVAAHNASRSRRIATNITRKRSMGSTEC